MFGHKETYLGIEKSVFVQKVLESPGIWFSKFADDPVNSEAKLLQIDCL